MHIICMSVYVYMNICVCAYTATGNALSLCLAGKGFDKKKEIETLLSKCQEVVNTGKIKVPLVCNHL